MLKFFIALSCVFAFVAIDARVAFAEVALQCQAIQQERENLEKICESDKMRAAGACKQVLPMIMSLDKSLSDNCPITSRYNYGDNNLQTTAVPDMCMKTLSSSSLMGMKDEQILTYRARQVYERSIAEGDSKDSALLLAQMVSLREQIDNSESHPALSGPKNDEYKELINTLDMLILSEDVYNDSSRTDTLPKGLARTSPEELEVLGMTGKLIDENFGYFAAIYKDTRNGAKNKYIYVNRGTQPPSLKKIPELGKDLVENATQGLTGNSLQYNRAMENATDLQMNTNLDITFSGHSLGGGLATAQALVTSSNAVVFNPAGVNLGTIVPYAADDSEADDLVDAYIVKGEFLDKLNGRRFRQTVKVPKLTPPFYEEKVLWDYTAPSSLGTKHELPAYHSGVVAGRDYAVGDRDSSQTELHNLNYVLKGLLTNFCDQHFQ